MESTTEKYRAARDLLQESARDYAAAVARFSWPEFGERFNWAIDWFDAIARGVERTALWIVEEDGREARYSFDEMARRSDQVAAHLAAHGVARGDRVLLMLDNQVELWEAMLAAMKLGAVILPTTTAFGPTDLADRISRGGVKHVLANAKDAHKFDGVPGAYTRFAVGFGADGWIAYRDARRRPTRSCSISLPARRAGRSWSSTRRSRIRSGIWPRRSGSRRSPATCT